MIFPVESYWDLILMNDLVAKHHVEAERIHCLVEYLPYLRDVHTLWGGGPVL